MLTQCIGLLQQVLMLASVPFPLPKLWLKTIYCLSSSTVVHNQWHGSQPCPSKCSYHTGLESGARDRFSHPQSPGSYVPCLYVINWHKDNQPSSCVDSVRHLKHANWFKSSLFHVSNTDSLQLLYKYMFPSREDMLCKFHKVLTINSSD